MNRSTDSIWLQGIVEQQDGFEYEAVDRFAKRLLQFARKRMPTPLQRRIDAEDVVQSVFRSFFTRHAAGQFEFSEADDVWRLLAAMTWRKLMRSIRHHTRQQRDYHRELAEGETVPPSHSSLESPDPSPSSIAVMMELLGAIMQQLPESHQKILELHLQNYSIQEISVRRTVSMRTVNRALKTVRQIAYEMADAEADE